MVAQKLYQPTVDEHGNPGSTRSGFPADNPTRWIEIETHGWDTPAFLPGDPAGEAWQAEQLQAAHEAALLEQAENILRYREAGRLADRLERERNGAETSWAFVDLDDLFDSEQELPTVGAFHLGDTSNGGGVFYRGKVNEIHGPSESGKTMVLLHVVAQEIRAGRHAVMVDFEDGGQSIVNRLRHVFGLTREEIVKQFHYLRPETAFGEIGLEAISQISDLAVVVVDAVTESMSVAGLDGRNENEVAAWYNDFPKKVARLPSNPAVVVVDHTPQSDHGRQIGSQHKKSAIDGVSYTAEPVAPFVKGGRGQLRLRVAKDKPGGVRPDALPQDAGQQFWRGDFKIDGRSPGVPPKVELWGVDPKLLKPANGSEARDVVAPQLPPPALGPLLVALADDGAWMSTTDLGAVMGADTRNEKARVRSNANRLAAIGMIEKKDFSGSPKYRVSQSGIHSAGAWIAHMRAEREGAQGVIE